MDETYKNYKCYMQKDFKHYELLRSFLKDEITIYCINDLKDESLLSEDRFIITKEEQLICNKVKYDVYSWNEIFEKLYSYSMQHYIDNYDYYFFTIASSLLWM